MTSLALGALNAGIVLDKYTIFFSPNPYTHIVLDQYTPHSGVDESLSHTAADLAGDAAGGAERGGGERRARILSHLRHRLHPRLWPRLPVSAAQRATEGCREYPTREFSPGPYGRPSVGA
jgi:hypothetical protein